MVMEDPADVAETKPGRPERRALLRVMVVDDLPEMRFLLEIALSREPKVALVGEGDDGQQAVEKIELLRPELVVMDLQMPRLNGIEATKRIKELWPQVDVVAFTSSGPDDGRAQMAAAGAVASFDKHQLKELLDFIRERASRR